ncbi:hypothetical protein NQ315_003370 [Exocentrus adspersus]|uniref:Tyr recombinase domain-containing protein n=1 Tax=Exocentrus adspersus TaxID=1586481 RepID=A0AAV8VAC5_9CUCU|nr:hypothetical protein NQ315_003370 [Exocentrus adspersus]
MKSYLTRGQQLPTTLWSTYSMLKRTLNVKQRYRPKKSKVLTKLDIDKFLQEAPDETYLLLKVIIFIGITFGIYGACRRSELLKLTIDDIEDKYSIIITISSLRPHYTNIIGTNKIRKAPKEIATYLRLPDAESYTGHCFRRSSATLLADSGADFVSLKRHGGWRSTTVAEGYIEESIEKKIKISNNILSATPNTSSAVVTSCTQENITLNNAPVLPSRSQYCFNNCTITTFNLNATKVE